MNLPLLLLIAALATYRLARMLAMENGPANAFLNLRSWVCERTVNGWQCEGITCTLCLSFWVGWGVALLLPWYGWQTYILTALALSGATVVIHKKVG